MADFLEEMFDDSTGSDSRKARSVRRRWWQLSNTVRQGFIMGGIYLVLGAGQLILDLSGSAGIVLKIIGVAWLVLGGCHLVSAVALRRHERF
jgi:uncharacterized membrane protein HdeD (DUF308 family)